MPRQLTHIKDGQLDEFREHHFYEATEAMPVRQ